MNARQRDPDVEFAGPLGYFWPWDPGVEFEGPMGYFWPMQEVPETALIAGIAEIVRELAKRAKNDMDKDKEEFVEQVTLALLFLDRLHTEGLPLEERKRDG